MKISFIKRNQKVKMRVYLDQGLFEVTTGISAGQKDVHPESGIVGCDLDTTVRLSQIRESLDSKIKSILSDRPKLSVTEIKAEISDTKPKSGVQSILYFSDIVREEQKKYENDIIVGVSGRILKEASIRNLRFLFRMIPELNLPEHNVSLYTNQDYNESVKNFSKLKNDIVIGLINRGYDDASVNIFIAKIKGVLVNYFPDSTSRLSSFKYIRKIPQYEVHTLTQKQYDFLVRNTGKIINDCLDDVELLAMQYVYTSLTLALRYGDMVSLTRESLVRRGDQYWLHYYSNKTAHNIDVPVTDWLAEMFIENLKWCNHLLPYMENAHLNRTIKTVLSRYEEFHVTRQITKVKAGKIKTLTRFDWEIMHIHKMRSTCISQMLMSGMPESVVKEFSGHTANSVAFRRYVKINTTSKEFYFKQFTKQKV